MEPQRAWDVGLEEIFEGETDFTSGSLKVRLENSPLPPLPHHGVMTQDRTLGKGTSLGQEMLASGRRHPLGPEASEGSCSPCRMSVRTAEAGRGGRRCCVEEAPRPRGRTPLPAGHGPSRRPSPPQAPSCPPRRQSCLIRPPLFPSRRARHSRLRPCSRLSCCPSLPPAPVRSAPAWQTGAFLRGRHGAVLWPKPSSHCLQTESELQGMVHKAPRTRPGFVSSLVHTPSCSGPPSTPGSQLCRAFAPSRPSAWSTLPVPLTPRPATPSHPCWAGLWGAFPDLPHPTAGPSSMPHGLRCSVFKGQSQAGLSP